jgi:hypothetical protein
MKYEYAIDGDNIYRRHLVYGIDHDFQRYFFSTNKWGWIPNVLMDLHDWNKTYVDVMKLITKQQERLK